ncbi:unnamed protein product [Trypanosoma congolense IL3000]|uniref:WGS project CAEQ00000000 data, annotated contig 1131 n=1 Tax=Trypanosoma congolense (strain IL3000) TaxID=1068625 RepID=F9W3Z9_TRYCI|nr:unnamed protein product [Trypanosoma congolense IL3000]
MWMCVSQMRGRLREQLLRNSWDLFSHHIKTLGDRAKKELPVKVEAIVRCILNLALRHIQKWAHTQEQAQISMSSWSWSSPTPQKEEDSTCSDVEFLGMALPRRRKRAVPQAPPRGQEVQPEVVVVRETIPTRSPPPLPAPTQREEPLQETHVPEVEVEKAPTARFSMWNMEKVWKSLSCKASRTRNS